MRRTGRQRTWQRLGVLLVALLAVLAATTTATALPTGTGSIRVKITFSGTGTMTVDETYVYPDEVCTINTHDTMTLQWASTFDAGVVDGNLVSSKSLGLLPQGPGTFTMDSTISQGPGAVPGLDCTAAGQPPPCTGLISSGAQPTFDLSGGDVLKPITFDAQSATPSPVDSGCQAAYLVNAADNDLRVLESALPGAMTAHGELPAGALYNAGSPSVPVSYSTAPTQVPTSCPTGTSWNQYIPNTACSASMTWSGTVTFQSECGASNVAPNCIKQQVKKDAAELAKLDYSLWKGDTWSRSLNCKPHDYTEVGWMTGGAGACVGFKLLLVTEKDTYEQDKQIAADPPDAHYRSIAQPHTPPVKGLNKLRSLSPAAYRLMQHYLQITGLVEALVTAQNRAASAFAALLGGNTGAAGDLAKQDKAELAYAKQAAQLFGGQRKLARQAAAQLRLAALHANGSGSPLLVKNLRDLAATLTSKRAARADLLAVTVLNGIGR